MPEAAALSLFCSSNLLQPGSLSPNLSGRRSNQPPSSQEYSSQHDCSWTELDIAGQRTSSQLFPPFPARIFIPKDWNLCCCWHQLNCLLINLGTKRDHELFLCASVPRVTSNSIYWLKQLISIHCTFFNKCVIILKKQFCVLIVCFVITAGCRDQCSDS